MKKLARLLLACSAIALALRANAEQAWSYIGIPYVTDMVPGAMMPTLPTGADTPGFPYDPCAMPTPTFTGASNQYFVDSNRGNDSTAGNNGRGTIEKPRKSLPAISRFKWTLAAGTQIFVESGSRHFDGTLEPDDDMKIVSLGTSDEPCWIIGVGDEKPTFAGEKYVVSGTHLLIDNIRFASNAGLKIKLGNGKDGVSLKYGTIRNCLIDGLGSGENAAIGGSGVSDEDRSSFICLYRNVIRNLGKWDRADKNGRDKHGIQMTARTDHWWIVENEIYHCEGDSVQVNTSNQHNGNYTNRPHYIYIAGNHFYENYENAVDNKNCYHVIISQNLIHDFRNEYKWANATAIILANDSEGWLSGYEWAIFNEIYEAGTAIKIASNAALTIDDPKSETPVQTAGQRTYAIGNLIYDVGNGFNLDARGTSPNGKLTRTWFEETWIVSNTIHAKNAPIRQTRANASSGENSSHRIIGNLLYSDANGQEIELEDSEAQFNEVSYNFVYRASGPTTMTERKFDLAVGNSYNAPPVFADIEANDYTPLAGSASVDLIGFRTEPEPYSLFKSMYGIDIAVGYNGIKRATGLRWDAGAFEIETPTGALPFPPSALTISSN